MSRPITQGDFDSARHAAYWDRVKTEEYLNSFGKGDSSSKSSGCLLVPLFLCALFVAFMVAVLLVIIRIT